MKHPALTRVMAVVLAIVCVIMLIFGAVGIGEAESSYAEDLSEHEKLTEHITTYIELSEKLDGEDSYKEMTQKIDERQEQHDKDAGEYRTDLAERAATQGGYKQGADALWEAKVQTDGAYKAFYDSYGETIATLEAAEAQFAQKKAEAEATKTQLNALLTACSAAPSLPTEPQKPTEPTPPTAPNSDNYEGGTESAEYQAALADYNTKLEAYNADYAAYENALKEYQAQCDAYPAKLAEAQAARAYVMSQVSGALGAMGISADSPEAAAAAISGVIKSIDDGLAEGEKAIAEGRAKLEAGVAAINAAKGKVDGGLETIWYEMGKMDDEEPELEEKREELLAEAAQLEQDREDAKQRKEDERKLSSSRAYLKNTDGISALLESGAEQDGALADCAQRYAAEYFSTLNREHIARLVLSGLEIAGGVIGLMCMGAAFEKNKSRFMLLAPVVAAFLMAAGALLIAVFFKFDVLYSAIPVLIFAPVYLLVAAPKAKLAV